MTHTTAIPRALGAPLDPRRWAALAVLLVGAFLAPLDFFIVNVAMPAIRGGLGASPDEVQLVISGYAVVYAVFLITGGRLGDIYGRKSVFMIGLAGFALASGLCGLAWSPASLILGRLLQALAAAAMAPQALASVHALFPPHERGRALSIYGVTIGLSSIAGQALGGALVAADIGGFGWRLIFLINLPVALGAFIAAIPLLRETRGANRPKLDLGGVALVGRRADRAGAAPDRGARARLAVVVDRDARRRRPSSPKRSAAMRSALRARGGEPLVEMAAFRSPGVKRGLGRHLDALRARGVLPDLLDLSARRARAGPLAAGLAIAPFSVGFLTSSTFSPAIGARAGARRPRSDSLPRRAG